MKFNAPKHFAVSDSFPFITDIYF